jgi:NADH:ubiquinone oxidoreductase subunit 6 (subunit J)
VLLIAVGPLVGLSEAGLIGAIVIAACLSLWAFSQSFGKWVKGRRGFHPFLTLAALIVLGLVVLGAIDLRDTVKEVTWEDVSSRAGWAWEHLSGAWTSNLLFRYAVTAAVLILALMGLVKLWELKPWRWVTSSLARLWHAIRPAQ